MNFSSLIFFLLASIYLFPTTLLSQDHALFKNTVLTSFSDDIPKAELARSLETGGYELADGQYQEFSDWYSRDNMSIYIEGTTLISKDWSVDWGFSTGETGEKYTLTPSFKLGFNYSLSATKDWEVVFSGYRVFGGKFSEKTCVADYGSLGSIYEVNCRLAATELPPEDTLEYLVTDNSEDWGLSVRIGYHF